MRHLGAIRKMSVCEVLDADLANPQAKRLATSGADQRIPLIQITEVVNSGFQGGVRIRYPDLSAHQMQTQRAPLVAKASICNYWQREYNYVVKALCTAPLLSLRSK